MLALIDADIVVHRVAHTTNNDPEAIARYRFDEMVDGILRDVEATEYALWLSDSRENNFRTQLCPNYKATRTQPRPKHYEYLKDYCIYKWEARIAFGMEADDALGIAQNVTFHCPPIPPWYATVICSIDKDLLQIPGLHYNFVKKEFVGVTRQSGLKLFYKQLIVGDRTDNVPGYDGKIRDTKIPQFLYPTMKQLEACVTEEQMFGLVQYLYQNDENLLLSGRLLKIRQKEDEPLWNHPSLASVAK